MNRNSLWWCSPCRRPTANGKRTRVQTPSGSEIVEMRGFLAAEARAVAVPGAGGSRTWSGAGRRGWPCEGGFPGGMLEAGEGGRRALLGVIM